MTEFLRTIFAPDGKSRKISVIAVFLAFVGVAYLIFKCYQVSWRPGYDIKFLWLAGKLWLEGINPYGPEYQALGPSLIAEGNIPEMWVYPPAWLPVTTLLGRFELLVASNIWNVVNAALLVWASVFLVRAVNGLSDENLIGSDKRLYPGLALSLLGLHIFAVSGLEASALVLSVGQTSMVIYLGLAILLFGLCQERPVAAAVGLVLVMLKPQMGAVFALPLIFAGPWERRVILYAIAGGLVVTLPALIADPLALVHFVGNIAQNDGYTIANGPGSMTGIRSVVWEFTGTDIGAMIATLLTIALTLGLTVWPARLNRSKSPAIRRYQTIAIACAATFALSPLHYYDFVIVGAILLFVPMANSRPANIVGILGMALVWRADNLGRITGFHDGIEILPGSRLATIGAILLAIAVLIATESLSSKRGHH